MGIQVMALQLLFLILVFTIAIQILIWQVDILFLLMMRGQMTTRVTVRILLELLERA